MKTRSSVFFTIFVMLVSFLFVGSGFAATSAGPVYGGGGGSYEPTPCSAFFEYLWKARAWKIDVAERPNGFYTGQPAPWAIRSTIEQWQQEGLIDEEFDAGIVQFILDYFGIYPASIGYILSEVGVSFFEFKKSLGLLGDALNPDWMRPLSAPEVEVLLAKAVEILAAKNEVPLLIESESLYLDPRQQNLSAPIQFKWLSGLGSKISGVFGVSGDFLDIEGGLLLQYWENGQYKTILMNTLGNGSLGTMENATFNLATTQLAIGSVFNNALIHPATEYSVKITFYGEVEWYGAKRVVSQTIPVTYRLLRYAVVDVNGSELSVTSSADAVIIGGNFTVNTTEVTDSQSGTVHRIIDAEVSVNGESYNLAARLVWKQEEQAMYAFNFGRVPVLYPGQETKVKIVGPVCSSPYLEIQSLGEDRLNVEHIYGNAGAGGGGGGGGGSN
ncbi:hypothetical protein COT99_03635 [Candidatus Falkowbacteria bacterium CG10_big_fil_rev_8_21_14_0_10_43_10]|uniref:SLH domain-containing protein n=1 Tax=Candidatus Falkowbacteria bacterium CG10_big_fil_rev_8_21_14_0_10_43_10 TaxID=1974567 RepID=A0A2H0V3A8_9BACT|nr:MAG: hypothetical protein COT99_03635 [Candidatus Falkowbacteria bacterium CG10_big_fil_rev_8_21_14_0_10_43_10]